MLSYLHRCICIIAPDSLARLRSQRRHPRISRDVFRVNALPRGMSPCHLPKTLHAAERRTAIDCARPGRSRACRVGCIEYLEVSMLRQPVPIASLQHKHARTALQPRRQPAEGVGFSASPLIDSVVASGCWNHQSSKKVMMWAKLIAMDRRVALRSCRTCPSITPSTAIRTWSGTKPSTSVSAA